MSKHYAGDVGTEILVDVKSNITTATELVLRIRKPSGTLVNWTGTLEGLTKIKYIVQDGDWNEVGVYRLQAYVVMPTWRGLGDNTTFELFAAFK